MARKRKDPCWKILGLEPDAEEAQVRRAYARKLKELDQATQRSEFQELRDAYDRALQILAGKDVEPEPDEEQEEQVNLGQDDAWAVRREVGVIIQAFSGGRVDEAVAGMRQLAAGPLCEVFTGRWEAIRSILAALEGDGPLPGRFCLGFLEAFGIDESLAQSLGRPNALERVFEIRDAKIWTQDCAAAWREKWGGFRVLRTEKPSVAERVLQHLRSAPRRYRDPLDAILRTNDPVFFATLDSTLDWIQGLVGDPECLGLHPASVAWWRRRGQFRDWPFRRDFLQLSAIPLLSAALVGLVLALQAWEPLAKAYDLEFSAGSIAFTIGGVILAGVSGIALFLALIQELVSPVFRRLLSLSVPRWLDPSVATATTLPLALMRSEALLTVLLSVAVALYGLFRLWGSGWGAGWLLMGLLTLTLVEVFGKEGFGGQGWVDALALASAWGIYFAVRWFLGRKKKEPEAKAAEEGNSYWWVSWIVGLNLMRHMFKEGWDPLDWKFLFLVAIAVIYFGQKFNWLDAMKSLFRKRSAED